VFEMAECPSCLTTPTINLYLRTHKWVRRGFLPRPGTWMEQPNHLMAAVDLIDRLLARFEARAAETSSAPRR
jgi:hypothetical protein